jgi:phytoene dehydrogenase-like protein
MSEKYDYDAVIIGAGISGLVCGCYLAKAGLKTLIVEKNAKPGGYCTSFTRDVFHFDACVHSLGSLRKRGDLRGILKELDLEKKLDIKRYDPSDIIITPDYKISFWNDLDKTIREFQDNFPHEAKNIKQFFEHVLNFNALTSASLVNKTFEELLNQHFKNRKLKAVLSLPILGNAGLPPSMISAFPAVMLYKEFILDGGYYPKNGMQDLPDKLTERFQEFGGSLMFKQIVNKIGFEYRRKECFLETVGKRRY